MDIVQLLISLASGVAGGNIAGTLLNEKNLGVLGNSVAGFFGGGIGGYILQALGALGTAGAASAVGAATAAGAAHGLDVGSLLANVGGSGVGGAVLTVLASLAKGYLNKA